MLSFVFAAALLGLLAIAFAVSALWQRSWKLALALAIVLPSAAAGLYLLKGEPAALDASNVKPPSTVAEAAAQLQRRLASEPESFENEVVLARSYMAVSDFNSARDHYARAVKLDGSDVDVQVEYAESLLRSSPDRRFPPMAVRMLERAVAQSPGNQRALFFLGIQRMQDKRPAEAAALWEKLLALLSPEAAAALRPQVDAARLAAGLPALAAARPVIASGAGIEVELRIDPTLAALVHPGDILYVFARALDGRGPPFAVKRVVLQALPIRIHLSDADSPMPAARLSSQSKVQLMARVSRSGDARPASGDIQADPQQVQVGGKAATLILNRPVP